jgi:predicted ribosome quality control (RQC) complex YloA/Tae2 family protein
VAQRKPIPFDSLCLAAALYEARSLVGAKLQKIVQPDERSLALTFHGQGATRRLFLSASPHHPRLHLSSFEFSRPGEQPPLGAALRRVADGARVLSIRQIGFDRQAKIVLGKADAEFQLIAELTGKHANLILVGPDGKVMAAAHAVPRSKSVRPILPGHAYEKPPFPPRRPVYEARDFEALNEAEGASPFLLSLLRARAGLEKGERSPEAWPRLRDELELLGYTVRANAFQPVEAGEWGAYPVSVAALGYEETSAESFSRAAERHFRELDRVRELEGLRSRLLAQLERVVLARDVALQELAQAEELARGAGRLQLMGELLLAYATTIEPGASRFETQDYEGEPLAIPLEPGKSPLENAHALFEKARKAKDRKGHVADQATRLEADRRALWEAIRQVREAETAAKLSALEAEFRQRRWLLTRAAPAAEKDRPYEGHRIRELLGPGGVRVLYGENAAANDYLTHRVARPNDYWLHVRAGVSAHVVIPTGNRPERVGREALLFGAQVAVRNSPAKHAGIVPVDYTLKKYVRKPRGAKPGTATYTHEKTLHVERGES